MRKVSKMGMTALALALSVTMIAPINAHAEIMKNYDSATDTYTYVNEDTNEVVTYKKGEGEMRSESLLSEKSKVFYIPAGQYYEIPSISTTPDVQKFTDFKSGNKNLKLRMYDRIEQTNCGEPDYAYTKKENGVTRYYYRDTNGNWQAKDKKELEAIYKGKGSYTLQFYAKKPGKYKVTFNARNAEGAVVANKTIKIIAKEDTRPIKSITYGGKNVLTDTDGDGRADYTNYYAQRGGYTKKKKGKLVVKANKGFKIKKLEVSPVVISTKNYDEDGWTGTQNSYNAEMDLNGNGSTKDRVNGVCEQCVSRTWKTIKNNKVLKLYKVNDEETDNYNLVNKKDNTKTMVRDSHGVIHPTYLRVTYYDTKNHKTLRKTYTLWLLKK